MRIRLNLTPSRQAKLKQAQQDVRDDRLLGATGSEWTGAEVVQFLLNRALDDWEGVSEDGKSVSPLFETPPARFSLPQEGLDPDTRARLDRALADGPADEVSQVLVTDEDEDDEDDEDDWEEDEEEDAELPDTYRRISHWDYFDTDGPWEFPEEENEVSAYYTDAGWIRMGIPLEDRFLSAYWTPLRVDQEARAPYPKNDGYNRTVKVQSTPEVGQAHIIPEDWGTDRPTGPELIVFGGN